MKYCVSRIGMDNICGFVVSFCILVLLSRCRYISINIYFNRLQCIYKKNLISLNCS